MCEQDHHGLKEVVKMLYFLDNRVIRDETTDSTLFLMLMLQFRGADYLYSTNGLPREHTILFSLHTSDEVKKAVKNASAGIKPSPVRMQVVNVEYYNAREVRPETVRSDEK